MLAVICEDATLAVEVLVRVWDVHSVLQLEEPVENVLLYVVLVDFILLIEVLA